MPSDTESTVELVGWFHPFRAEEASLPGVLTITPLGKIGLRIINQANPSPTGAFLAMMPDHPRPWHLTRGHQTLVGTVSGKTQFGRLLKDAPVTLDHCQLLTFGSFQQPRDIRFTVGTAYVGLATDSVDALLWDACTSRITGLEGWLNSVGPPASLRTKRPRESLETTATVEGLGSTAVKLAIWRQWSREKANAYEVYDSGYVIIQPERPSSWGTLREVLKDVHEFLCFALDRTCAVQLVQSERDGQIVEIVEQVCRDDSHRPYRPTRLDWDALFTAAGREAGVVGSAAAVLRRWLEVPRKARGALVRLHTLSTSAQLVETQALLLSGAAELWQKHILPGSDGGSVARRVKAVFDPLQEELNVRPTDDHRQVSGTILEIRNRVAHGGLLELDLLDTAAIVGRARAILKLRVLEFLGVDWRAVAKFNSTILWEAGLDQRDAHALPYPVYRDTLVLDAALDYLKRFRARTTLNEIATALEGGGWSCAAKNAEGVISHALNEYRKTGGPVSKTRFRRKVYWQWDGEREASSVG